MFNTGRPQQEPDPDIWPDPTVFFFAMNDFITAHEIVCYKVNAVHYLNRSQVTRMVHLNHALQDAAAALLPYAIPLSPTRRTVFLG